MVFDIQMYVNQLESNSNPLESKNLEMRPKYTIHLLF
jgi:hypothetical protein